MDKINIYLLFVMLLVFPARKFEAKLTASPEHKLNMREDIVNKHQRDPGKLLSLGGKLQPIPELSSNTTRLYDVKAIEGKAHNLRNHSQNRNYQSLFQLTPPNQFGHRSYSVRSQKIIPRDNWNRGKYHNSRSKTPQNKQPGNLPNTLSRWFFSDDSDETMETRPPKILQRHSSHHSLQRPTTYYNYPPYWQSPPSPPKFNSFPRFQKGRAIHHRPVTNNKINFIKHECNACNSVPWTPILKPSAVHPDSFGGSQSYGVPTIEVHHDSSAYDSKQQHNIVPPPAPVIEHIPDSTIPASYGLPLGNIPTAHGLLPPINRAKPAPAGLVPPPPTLLSPVPTNGLLQSIPFPELSPIPIVPLHSSNQFLQVETSDLVPPIPPQKSISNVVLTISENGPVPNDGLIDNHINQGGTIHGSDQHSESSSYVNSHLITHNYRPYNQFTSTNNHVNFDVVKSVPVAEFTSSIEYPLQIIQAPQYIDITTAPNLTKTEPPTYEKQSQTGSQKISDILFGLVKDTTPKTSGSTGNQLLSASTQRSTQLTKTQQANHYLPTVLPPISNEENIYENGHIYGHSQQFSNVIYNKPQDSVWLEQGGNSQSFSSFQPNLESGNGGLFPDPTSTSWIIPAQSNHEPQWILPVSNSPSVPYSLLPEEEGIASAVNTELSPTPPPQPMNDSKTKKIQIIIPYTTGENINNGDKNYDQNILEAAQSEIFKTAVHANDSKPELSAPKQEQNRKIIGKQTAEFTVPANFSQNSKFINDVQHILAVNIKELLKDEEERPKTEQNIRLQKNIDNWTALEYSNHKTVAKKEPLDVISFANAVTSIPGTSISHLLLTSKKIPDKYLTTTPLPKFDEPTTHFAPASSVSVESKPFTTKTYDTSGLYSTVTRIAPKTTTIRTALRDALRPESETKNHRNFHTEVKRTKANQWGKLNENLVLPEKVSNRSTTPSWQKTDDGIYVVTPVSVWKSEESGKRTTRQVTMTEKPGLVNATISAEVTKSYFAKLFGNKTERAKISKFNKPKLIQKFYPTAKPPPRNITKVQIKPTRIERLDEVEPFYQTTGKSINDVFPFRNGGELPLELAISNTTKDEPRTEALVKKNENFEDAKIFRDRSYLEDDNSTLLTTTEIPENATIELQLEEATEISIENSTEIFIDFENDNGGFGQKIIKDDKKNLTKSVNSIDYNSKKEKQISNLPPGIFGETKRVHVARDEELSSEIASIDETIRLLKEYLKDTSDELPKDKTEDEEYFKEEDRPSNETRL